MPENLTNVDIPNNVWTNIYALSGVPVGAVLSVQNIGAADVYLAVAAVQPPPDHDAYNVISRKNGLWLRNSVGDPGAWAFCQGSAGKLSVRRIG